MSDPSVQLAFFKLNVPEIVPALAFWREAFGFELANTVDEPDFHEKILHLPEQPGGPSLMLVNYKDGRDVSVGPGHGAVGLVCSDVAASFDRAKRAGATVEQAVFEAGGVLIAVLRSPEGHEIELVQLPG